MTVIKLVNMNIRAQQRLGRGMTSRLVQPAYAVSPKKVLDKMMKAEKTLRGRVR